MTGEPTSKAVTGRPRPAGVVRLISDRTAATVAVLTQLMDVLTAAAPGVAAEKAAADVREHMVHPRLGQVLRASRLSQRALRLPKVGGMPAVIVAPIQVGDEVPSYLVTVDPAENLFGEDMSLLVTEHAATICGVILGRERVVAAASRRVRDDLVEGLLLGRGRDNADASRWAAHLGYDPARDHNVLAIAFELPPSAVPGHEDDAAPRERIRESIEHFVATRAPEAIASARECEVVVVTAAPIDARHLAAACLAGPRASCMCTRTRWPTGSSGSRRSPGCDWTTTPTGSSPRWRWRSSTRSGTSRDPRAVRPDSARRPPRPARAGLRRRDGHHAARGRRRARPLAARAQPVRSWPGQHDPRELPQRRRGHHPDQHLRRQPALARRPRLRRQGGRDQPGRGPHRPRGSAPLRPGRAGRRVPTPSTWPCTCSSRPAWRPSPR